MNQLNRYSDPAFENVKFGSTNDFPCTPSLPPAPWEGIRINVPKWIDLRHQFTLGILGSVVIPICCKYRIRSSGKNADQPFVAILVDSDRDLGFKGVIADENESLEAMRPEPGPPPPGYDAETEGETMVGGNLNFDLLKYIKSTPLAGKYVVSVKRGELNSNEIVIELRS